MRGANPAGPGSDGIPALYGSVPLPSQRTPAARRESGEGCKGRTWVTLELRAMNRLPAGDCPSTRRAWKQRCRCVECPRHPYGEMVVHYQRTTKITRLPSLDSDFRKRPIGNSGAFFGSSSLRPAKFQKPTTAFWTRSSKFRYVDIRDMADRAIHTITGDWNRFSHLGHRQCSSIDLFAISIK